MERKGGLETEGQQGPLKTVHCGHKVEYHPHSSGTTSVVVFGATGKQGGSVICALAQDGKYRLRGVSKETDVPRYRDLEQSGIEMVKANIATGEGLEEAFRDAQVAFIVLPSFDKEIIGKEYNYGTTLIEKAKYHGIRTLIFSTAVNTSDISGKKYCIPHFDEKARVEEYIRAIQKTKDAFDHVAFVAPSFYFQNFSWKSFAPKQMGDHHVFRFPHVGVLTGCDIHDLGYVVKEVIENPKKYDNRTIILNSEEAPLQGK
eukprot:TRINITY_DN20437_c0_g1_i2.p1 TRINITY_DN20437_c0_g1~~TRINITY_DN20437_c0_g1_i2.p1  ORF type:complete len:259 (-),score=32.38 TRINITY_DN20437_c0_g1_i2:330-1106(-)